MASFRHLARIAVMQTLFAYEFHGGDPNELLTYMLHEFAQKVEEPEFAQQLLKGVLEKRGELQEEMKVHAPEWPVEKVAPLDRAILYIGLYELKYAKDVPPLVAVNEAIELAKSYGGPNSSKFINGVLSAVMNQSRNGEQVEQEGE